MGRQKGRMAMLECSGDALPGGARSMLDRVFDACAAAEGISSLPLHAHLMVMDDARIRELNRDTRGVDRPTDVLSYPQMRYARGQTARDCVSALRGLFDPDVSAIALGDIALSLDRARAQAAEYGHSLDRELGYLTAHALFHLFGYDHIKKADRARMRRREEQALDALGITRDAGEGDNMGDVMGDAFDFEALFEAAEAAMRNAYAPFSNFRVGAALRAGDGRVFVGCNVENSSYGLTLCAERGALCAAIAAGARAFTDIAIVSGEGLAYPCGACRQALYEFAPELRVHVRTPGCSPQTHALSQLLPHGFRLDAAREAYTSQELHEVPK